MRVTKVSKKKHKYKAKPQKVNGQKYRSKLEMQIDGLLKTLWQSKEIMGYYREIPIELPALTPKGKHRKHYIDFEVSTADGKTLYIEAKGHETPLGKLKRELTEYILRQKIHVCKNQNDVLKVIQGEN